MRDPILVLHLHLLDYSFISSSFSTLLPSCAAVLLFTTLRVEQSGVGDRAAQNGSLCITGSNSSGHCHQPNPSCLCCNSSKPIGREILAAALMESR